MKTDFNNPVVIVNFKNKGQWVTLQKMFGGPEPYGWLTSCSMELKLGNVANFEVTLTMPRREGLDMLSEFVKGNQSVSLGEDMVSAKFGYVPNYFSQEFKGMLVEFPDLQLGEQITMTLKCVGVQQMLFTDNTAEEYSGKSYSDIVMDIIRRSKMNFELVNDFNSLMSIMKAKNTPENATMYMTDAAQEILKKTPTDITKSVSKNENSWKFIQKLFTECGIGYVECGIVIGVFELSQPSKAEPNTTFVYFGKIDIEKRMIPFESLNIDFLPTAFTGSGSVVEAPYFDETKPGAGKLPDITNNLNGKGISQGTKDSLTSEKSGSESDASKKVSSDKIFGVSKFLKSDNDAKSFSIGQTNSNQLVSIKSTLNSIGIPDLLPGEMVVTDMGRDGLKWNWQILKVHHQWSGEYKCDYEFLIGGNPFSKPNTSESTNISNVDVKEIDSSVGVA